jgi:hypothetical protein
MRNAGARLIECSLARSPRQLLAQIGVRLKLLLFAEHEEDSFAGIGEHPALDENEQPFGQAGRQISLETERSPPARACSRSSLAGPMLAAEYGDSSEALTRFGRLAVSGSGSSEHAGR